MGKSHCSSIQLDSWVWLENTQFKDLLCLYSPLTSLKPDFLSALLNVAG